MSVRSSTILLVDDEAPQREQMRRALRSAGYQVLVCSDYGGALAHFQQHSGEVDLLITDLALPGKNGFQLAQALCEIRPRLKVLFTSAQAGAELNRYYGIHQSDLNFLAKPFQSMELIARVNHCLESGGAQYGSAGC